MRNVSTAVGLIATLVLSGLLSGCGGGGSRREAVITVYPQWEFEGYERIAVMPGRAVVPAAVRDAGLLADRLTTLLQGSRKFEVLSRTELDQVFEEQDLAKIADAIDEGTALPTGRIRNAQAIVSTTLTDYVLIADSEVRREPRFALDARNRPYIAGYDEVLVFRHGAQVEGTVRVVDAATGRILLSHTARVAPRPKTARGAPPRETPQQIAAEAARELSVEFFKRIAPITIEVKLDRDMLFVATDYFDGRYRESRRLPLDIDDFYLVIRDLPEECQRNDFRVAISELEGRTNLFEAEFMWVGGLGPEGQSYRIPLQTLTATGGEQFVAKLYAGRDPRPILTSEFRLEIPK